MYVAEKQHKMAIWMGLEPTTSAVTGRRSKPTELPDRMVEVTGLEPVTLCL